MSVEGRSKREQDMSATEYSERERVALRVDDLTYDAAGLLPVVVQDAQSLAVLMLAWANREAVQKTLDSGYAWFWSRSRGKFWMKGEESGNTQAITEVRYDCDGDALLYVVEAAGPACHTGESTCFYRTLE